MKYHKVVIYSINLWAFDVISFPYLKVCPTDPCANDEFCNYDNEKDGFCERCEAHGSCSSLGLSNQKGEIDCNAKCEGK